MGRLSKKTQTLLIKIHHWHFNAPTRGYGYGMFLFWCGGVWRAKKR
jgi:hypothetical protein